MEDERNERSKKMHRIIAKAWADESFKERLLTDSRAVLEGEGIPVSPGVEVKVLEQTDTQFYIVLPKKPTDSRLIEELDHREAAAWGGNGGNGGAGGVY
jgi:hypothetical protein